MSDKFYDIMMEDIGEEGSEKTASEGGYKPDEEKTASGRPLASQISQSVRPTMAVGFHPQNQTSMLFIKRLDKALQDTSGLERMKITVLNPLLDATAIDKLGVPVPGAVIYRSNKKIGEIGGGDTAMAMTRYLNENKSKFIS